MLELVIRLHEMRCCYARARVNPQLTRGEKAAVGEHKQLVRECLPADVLVHYDRMKKTERSLQTCPTVFAMAVLVATYRGLSPAGRRRLVAHFDAPSPAPSSWGRNGKMQHSGGERPLIRTSSTPALELWSR